MKRLIALAAALIMLMGCALAEGAEYAACGLDGVRILKYASFSENEDGFFSYKTPKAQAVENVFNDRAQAIAGNGLLAFFTEVQGNAETGVSYPVLKVIYAGGIELKADYIAFVIDGVRYDFACARAASSLGRYRAETLTVYLDASGLEFVKKLSEAEKVSVALLGADMFIMNIENRETYANQRLEIAGESLEALSLPDGAPDYNAYAFSDEAKALFESKYGEVTDKAYAEAMAECEIVLDKTFGLAADGANGNSIRAVQRLLKQAGFYQAAEGTVVTPVMIDAVKSAQTYYGLMPTGYADARLIGILNGSVEPEVTEETALEKAAYDYETDKANFSLNRWWTARRADTTALTGGVSAQNKDNVLVIADGDIAATGLEAMSLSWEAGAELVLNDTYSFPANLYAETNGGEILSTTLDVCARTRLLFVAEVPEYLFEEDAEWTAKIRIGLGEFEIELLK